MTLTIAMTPTGPQPQDPAALNAELIAEATALAPGLTADLPGSLIEDMSSTATGALIVCDQAMVESINNVTPLGANEFMLGQLGQVYGVQPGTSTNTSVYVVFTGTVGFIIPIGFTVSDGSHQYIVQDGGVIESGGSSSPLYCTATQTGAWAVPADTVTNLVTGVPGAITLTVNNPSAGTPSPGPESVAVYRSRILAAGKATSIGALPYLKTQILAVSGVQERLVSVRQANGGYEIIAGGGDPYAVAYAIYKGLFDLNTLKGSVLNILTFSEANPGVAETDLNHGFATGQVITVAGSNPGAYDGTYTITVIDEKTFSVGVDTSAFGTYIGDAVVTPNLRNQVVTVNDYPDSYDITFVVPPSQTVAIDLVWNTSSANVISNTAVQNLSAPVMAAYVNLIPVGQPINVFELQASFMEALTEVIPPEQITKMIFTVSINGVVTAPGAGTGIISGDPESYFSCLITDITLTRA